MAQLTPTIETSIPLENRVTPERVIRAVEQNGIKPIANVWVDVRYGELEEPNDNGEMYGPVECLGLCAIAEVMVAEYGVSPFTLYRDAERDPFFEEKLAKTLGVPSSYVSGVVAGFDDSSIVRDRIRNVDRDPLFEEQLAEMLGVPPSYVDGVTGFEDSSIWQDRMSDPDFMQGYLDGLLTYRNLVDLGLLEPSEGTSADVLEEE